MINLFRRLKYILKYVLWILNGVISVPLSVDTSKRVTVLITYFNPIRMKHLEPQVRNLLKCNFVEKIIISNHNPDVCIEDWLKIEDEHLIFINQEEKKGCGYRWSIANEFDPDYLIVVDDDILLFPHQLAALFKYLVNEPMMPHGISGFVRHDKDELEFHDNANMDVTFLCETYAVPRDHLKRYMALKELVATNDNLANLVESAADFMIISRTGSHNSKIHDVGRIFRSHTFKQIGVAVHKEESFNKSLKEIGNLLNKEYTENIQ